MRHFFALSLLALAGCAVSGHSSSTSSPSAVPPPPQVKVTHDDVLKLTTWEGQNCASDAHDVLFLRAVKADGEQVPSTSFTMYVSEGYTGASWRTYFRADDSEGHQLPLQRGDHFVADCSVSGDSCSYAEDFVLQVSKAYLLQHQGSGIRFQLSGKHGSAVFDMPASYIGTFLAQVP